MSSNIVRDQEHFSYPSCMKYLVGTFLIYWWPIVPFQVTRTLLQLRGEYIIYLFLLLSLMLFVFFLFVIIFSSSLHRFLFHSFIDHTSCYSIDGNALSFLFFFCFSFFWTWSSISLWSMLSIDALLWKIVTAEVISRIDIREHEDLRLETVSREEIPFPFC